MRILYVEDEEYLADAVIHMLKKDNIEVDWASDGEEGLTLAVKPIYDAIVLDIMLPKLSGLDILTTIRNKGITTPVIMLSALSEVEDKVSGLEKGADDYLAKPFKTTELVARLNALTRRPPLQSTEELTYADLTLDLTNRTANGTPLTEKEADILELLMRTPDSIQQKEHVLAHVWGAEAFGDDNYVEVYMSHLRKKLRSVSQKVKIKTIRNLGYKLCSES